MKIRHHFLLIILAIPFISCNQKVEKSSKLSLNQKLGNGEWLDVSDTVNGISVRENRIAYFENMQFSGDQINDYQIIDSIHKIGDEEKKVGEYLIIKINQDTLQLQIIKRDKSLIILNDPDEGSKEFKFWR